MKPEELRIGNLVKENDEISARDLLDMYEYQQDFEGIPLNEDWLINFGFEKDDVWMKKVVFSHNDKDFERVLMLTEWNSYWSAHINRQHICNVKHVHQLQNLYHALTDQELTIKETV